MKKELRYALLVDHVGPEGLDLESYGVAVEDGATGERAELRHITPFAGQAVALLDLLSRNGVSPVATLDVIEDWLLR